MAKITFSLRSLFLGLAAACVCSLVIAKFLVLPSRRGRVSVVSMVWQDMSVVRIYSVPKLGNEVTVYYDFPPYGSLDEVLQESASRSQRFVSKSRNFTGRSANEFDSQDEERFLAIANYVDKMLAGKSLTLNRPVTFELRPDAAGQK